MTEEAGGPLSTGCHVVPRPGSRATRHPLPSLCSARRGVGTSPGRPPVGDEAHDLREGDFSQHPLFLVQEAQPLPAHGQDQLGLGQPEAWWWRRRAYEAPGQGGVGTWPCLWPHPPMPSPDTVVTSKSRENSSGHCRRAASTTCSRTAWGAARCWVHGACVGAWLSLPCWAQLPPS